MSVSRILFLFGALLLAAGPGFAQSEQSDDSSRTMYHVEVIAFEYRGPDSSAGEEFDRILVSEYLPRAPFDFDEYNRVRELVSYTELTQLGGALERLRASPQYSVMAAAAWVQPLLSQSEAVEVPLGYDSGASIDTLDSPSAGPSPGPAPPQLTGSVRIYGDHLLFVDIDLRASLPRRQDAPGSGPEQASDGAGDGGTGFERTRLGSGLASFRISQRRRIKLEEAHYFDHPYIGAILLVTRYEGEGGSG